jgi:Zn-dependent peptidase ImmA (M78 family)
LIPPKITIYYADIKGSTPAKCNRRTGDIYLNTNVINKYKHAHKLFIILHEMGHIYCQARSEYTADEWAHNQYLLAGYTAQQAYEAAKATMPPINAQLRNRVKILQLNSL